MSTSDKPTTAQTLNRRQEVFLEAMLRISALRPTGNQRADRNLLELAILAAKNALVQST